MAQATNKRKHQCVSFICFEFLCSSLSLICPSFSFFINVCCFFFSSFVALLTFFASQFFLFLLFPQLPIFFVIFSRRFIIYLFYFIYFFIDNRLLYVRRFRFEENRKKRWPNHQHTRIFRWPFALFVRNSIRNGTTSKRRHKNGTLELIDKWLCWRFHWTKSTKNFFNCT